VAWLVCDQRVLASLEQPAGHGGRARGLLGRDGITGAMLLAPCRSVHTIGMRFAIDVAQCDHTLRVVRVVTLRPNRVCRPVRGATVVVEAAAGQFARWGVAAGDQLEVRSG
jgi:uncharacterized membrane protein (UPF0127 family)